MSAYPDTTFFDGGPPLKFERRLGLSRPGRETVLRRAVLAIVVGWIPLLVLAGAQSALAQTTTFMDFVGDFAVHSRSLIAVPLLLVARLVCLPRFGAIGAHFIDAGLVRAEDRPRFEYAVTSTRRFLDSTYTEAAVFSLAYLITIAVIVLVPATAYPSWQLRGDGSTQYSMAGLWHALISLPLLLVLLLAWFLRVLMWTRFLHLVSRLNLRLIPAHPDRAAGLRFVGYSVRACSIIGFVFGTIVAGMVANRVVHLHASPLSYAHLIGAVAVFSLVIFCGPLLTFAGKLLQEWRRGIFRYGALADRAGAEFEAKWLDKPATPGDSMLDVPDFSTCTDLYQVVSNVYEMRVIPLDLRSVVLLLLATLAPFVPVMLMAVPFDTVVAKIAGLLL